MRGCVVCGVCVCAVYVFASVCLSLSLHILPSLSCILIHSNACAALCCSTLSLNPLNATVSSAVSFLCIY